jgi:uncharacterized protein Yka (UPF0111/DUF47 family)
MSRVKILLILITIAACGALTGRGAYAQNNADDIRDRIEKIKLEKMVKKMELDESTAEIFKEKYKTFSASLRELTKKRAKAYLEMTQNIESGIGLDSLLNEILSMESQIDKERLDFIADLKTFLSAKQIAIMIVFERKFNIQLRKLLQDYRKLNNLDKEKQKNDNN